MCLHQIHLSASGWTIAVSGLSVVMWMWQMLVADLSCPWWWFSYRSCIRDQYSLPMHDLTGPYPDVPAVSPERALDVLCLLGLLLYNMSCMRFINYSVPFVWCRSEWWGFLWRWQKKKNKIVIWTCESTWNYHLKCVCSSRVYCERWSVLCSCPRGISEVCIGCDQQSDSDPVHGAESNSGRGVNQSEVESLMAFSI